MSKSLKNNRNKEIPKLLLAIAKQNSTNSDVQNTLSNTPSTGQTQSSLRSGSPNRKIILPKSLEFMYNNNKIAQKTTKQGYKLQEKEQKQEKNTQKIEIQTTKLNEHTSPRFGLDVNSPLARKLHTIDFIQQESPLKRKQRENLLKKKLLNEKNNRKDIRNLKSNTFIYDTLEEEDPLTFRNNNNTSYTLQTNQSYSMQNIGQSLKDLADISINDYQKQFLELEDEQREGLLDQNQMLNFQKQAQEQEMNEGEGGEVTEMTFRFTEQTEEDVGQYNQEQVGTEQNSEEINQKLKMQMGQNNQKLSVRDKLQDKSKNDIYSEIYNLGQNNNNNNNNNNSNCIDIYADQNCQKKQVELINSNSYIKVFQQYEYQQDFQQNSKSQQQQQQDINDSQEKQKDNINDQFLKLKLKSNIAQQYQNIVKAENNKQKQTQNSYINTNNNNTNNKTNSLNKSDNNITIQNSSYRLKTEQYTSHKSLKELLFEGQSPKNYEKNRLQYHSFNGKLEKQKEIEKEKEKELLNEKDTDPIKQGIKQRFEQFYVKQCQALQKIVKQVQQYEFSCIPSPKKNKDQQEIQSKKMQNYENMCELTQKLCSIARESQNQLSEMLQQLQKQDRISNMVFDTLLSERMELLNMTKQIIQKQQNCSTIQIFRLELQYFISNLISKGREFQREIEKSGSKQYQINNQYNNVNIKQYSQTTKHSKKNSLQFDKKKVESGNEFIDDPIHQTKHIRCNTSTNFNSQPTNNNINKSQNFQRQSSLNMSQQVIKNLNYDYKQVNNNNNRNINKSSVIDREQKYQVRKGYQIKNNTNTNNNNYSNQNDNSTSCVLDSSLVIGKQQPHISNNYYLKTEGNLEKNGNNKENLSIGSQSINKFNISQIFNNQQKTTTSTNNNINSVNNNQTYQQLQQKFKKTLLNKSTQKVEKNTPNYNNYCINSSQIYQKCNNKLNQKQLIQSPKKIVKKDNFIHSKIDSPIKFPSQPQLQVQLQSSSSSQQISQKVMSHTIKSHLNNIKSVNDRNFTKNNNTAQMYSDINSVKSMCKRESVNKKNSEQWGF